MFTKKSRAWSSLAMLVTLSSSKQPPVNTTIELWKPELMKHGQPHYFEPKVLSECKWVFNLQMSSSFYKSYLFSDVFLTFNF